jgi:hypothetical protein
LRHGVVGDRQVPRGTFERAPQGVGGLNTHAEHVVARAPQGARDQRRIVFVILDEKDFQRYHVSARYRRVGDNLCKHNMSSCH